MKQDAKLASCQGKHPYPSFEAAAGVASLQSHRKKQRVAPYKCVVCGWYHVGEQLHPRGIPKLKYKRQRAKRKERRTE